MGTGTSGSIALIGRDGIDTPPAILLQQFLVTAYLFVGLRQDLQGVLQVLLVVLVLEHELVQLLEQGVEGMRGGFAQPSGGPLKRLASYWMAVTLEFGNNDFLLFAVHWRQ
jgi:hypothetical protein